MAVLGRLHLVTDHRLGQRIPEIVAVAVAAGVDTVQVRLEAATGDAEALELTREVVRLCRGSGVTCLVNDRVDVALAAGADGVHLGAHDLPVAVARNLLGDRAIIGATARDRTAGLRAQRDGATYLGVGPFRATTTKAGLPAALGPVGIAAVAAAVRLPVIAIGGIGPADLPDLLAAGAYGVAVVKAVSAADDPAAAVGRLRAALASSTVTRHPAGTGCEPTTGTGWEPTTGTGSGPRGGCVDITVNGARRSVPDDATVDWLVAELLGRDRTGVAVAVNGTVVPQTTWERQPVSPEDRIEVIMALQGG